MGASPPALRLNALIPAVLAGAGDQLIHLDVQARHYTRRVVAARAPDVPEDVRDEIANQALASLLRFDLAALQASDLKPKGFFRLRVIEALRQVRASYVAPGRRTRPPAAPDGPHDGPGRLRPPPPIEDHADPEAEAGFVGVERRRDAATILAAAPPLVATALRLICFDDMDMTAAARSVGLSRFALKRRIDQFAAAYRMAA